MSVCPACGQNVRPLWPTCRTCGALLMAPPAPSVPVAAAGAAVATALPSAEEQFFAPAVLRPIVQLPPAPARRTATSGAGAGGAAGAGKWLALVAMVAFMVAAVATAWFTLRPAANAQHQTPAVLAPHAPTAGLPTSLQAIVRIQAESTRHIALQAVEQVGNGDLTALGSTQPSYRWLAGNAASTDAHTVSVAQTADVVTIAVAASNHDVCAFAQWLPGTSTAQYVTMEHEPTCAAVDAPSAGWSSQSGGAASDLPDDHG